MIRLSMLVLALSGCSLHQGVALDDAGSDPAVEDASPRELDASVLVATPRCGVASEWVPIAADIDTDLTAVDVISATEAWITGAGGALFHYGDGTVTRVEGPPTSEDIGDLWVDPEGELWLTAWTAAFRRGARGWQRLPLAMPAGSVVSTVWGSAIDDVWLGGGTASPQVGFLARWDGETMAMEDAPAAIQVTRIRGDDADFAVAHLGRVMRRDPIRGWENMELPEGQTITSVWPVGPDEAFFGAVYAQLHHVRDGVWRTYDSHAENTYYYAVWGCSRDDVWALGWEGSVAHFDGETLRAVTHPRPTHATIAAVDGEPGGLVLAVGDDGTILRLVPIVP